MTGPRCPDCRGEVADQRDQAMSPRQIRQLITAEGGWCVVGQYDYDEPALGEHARVVAWAVVSDGEDDEVVPVFVSGLTLVLWPDRASWQNMVVDVHQAGECGPATLRARTRYEQVKSKAAR